MPKCDKAVRRDKQRRKAINARFLNVRTNTLRAGIHLLQVEVRRTTKRAAPKGTVTPAQK